VLFGLISFWALREFITLTPTRLGDHRTLFWVFFLFTPLQFLLVALNQYGVYSVLIPVYAFLFIPARIAIAGDYKRFLERAAKIQSGLLICVYCLSFAPALLYLPIKKYEGYNARLLFFRRMSAARALGKGSAAAREARCSSEWRCRGRLRSTSSKRPACRC
jgi:phosphatidate cytidylyltransferase